MCIGCHGIPGYQASFPEVHRVPMIAGQGAKYIASSLNAYKKGERRHPSMRALSGSLSDADIADLAAFYEQQGSSAVKPVAARTAPAPQPEVAALLTKGACASCHGTDYNKPIDPAYPKIAGQHADYLYVALKAYKTEGNPDEPLSDEAAAEIQARVDRYGRMFEENVAANRGIALSVVRSDYGQGRMLDADAAKKAGMVDRVESFEGVVARLLSERPKIKRRLAHAKNFLSSC
jgi:cytochrome c553